MPACRIVRLTAMSVAVAEGISTHATAPLDRKLRAPADAGPPP